MNTASLYKNYDVVSYTWVHIQKDWNNENGSKANGNLTHDDHIGRNT
jgi:hypothetical protein